jgi:hypothetical protein
MSSSGPCVSSGPPPGCCWNIFNEGCQAGDVECPNSRVTMPISRAWIDCYVYEELLLILCTSKSTCYVATHVAWGVAFTTARLGPGLNRSNQSSSNVIDPELSASSCSRTLLFALFTFGSASTWSRCCRGAHARSVRCLKVTSFDS